jgi:Na+/melibiose symporter-like transporter
MTVSMFVSALGTQKAALAVQPDASRVHEVSILQLPKEMMLAMKNPSYRVCVLAGLALFVGYGITENMGNYMNTFFWGFTSEQLGVFIFVIAAGALVVGFSARGVVHRFGNRRVGIASAIGMNVLGPFVIALKLTGILPHAGDPLLFKILVVTTFISYASLIMGMTVIGTMIADITDEHELTTGARQEGLLFAANMFMSKAASGLGVLFAGFMIKLAHFPTAAQPGEVDPHVVNNLGFYSGLGAVLFGATIAYFFSRYTITPERHAEIQAELAKRRRLARTVAESAAKDHGVSGTRPAAGTAIASEGAAE